MTDFLDGLERDLVAAAGRQGQARRAAAAVRRRRLPSRGLAVGLAALLVAGSATAAVVRLAAEPSQPLQGPLVGAQPSSGSYAVSVVPEFRAGHAGWCIVVRQSRGGRSISASTGCGPARAAGGAQIAGGSVFGGGTSIRFAVVTAAVRTVRFAQALVGTRADRSLPHRWRYAVTTGGPSVMRPQSIALLDAAGAELEATTPEDRRSRGAGSRRVTRTRPARRCAIGRAAGYTAGYARVALGTPRLPDRIEGRAFASCAYTVFRDRDERPRLIAAILLDAQDPSARAAPLPRAAGLSGRRLGRGWIVVYGEDEARRAKLLDSLKPRL